MPTRPLLAAGALCAVLLVAALGWMLAGPARAPSFHGSSFVESSAAPDFALVDHTGRTAALGDYRGEAVLLFFGFTHCPDVCPTTLTRLTRIREELGRRGRGLRIVLVTVDPARDTPDVLAAYVARFGDGVTALTGDSARVTAAKAGYGVYAVAQPAHEGHAAIAHTDAIYGIDRDGRLRVMIAPDAPEEQMRADIATLLRM